MLEMNRRQFIAASLVTGVAMGAARGAENAGPPVCVFSKHLQFLEYKALAKTCGAIGLDGVDLTVREKGHVTPENVARDLPAAVEAIRAEGLDVPMITTALNDGADPSARPILEAASKLGIRYFPKLKFTVRHAVRHASGIDSMSVEHDRALAILAKHL